MGYRVWPLLVFLLTLLGCASEGDRPSKDQKPNILFLTVDTLRPDRTDMYAYDRSTMPRVAAFADSATTFDHAVVPRGSTRPSYASMLTGQYPFRNGVRSNRMVLHEDAQTLSETLLDEGYETAGFVSNFVLLGDFSGINQGFQIYDDFLDQREGRRNNYERRASSTLRSILEWLDSDPPEPFFLFVNLIDPHGPYKPPQKYYDMYKTDRVRNIPRGRIPPYQAHGDTLNFFDYVDRYDAEIRYVDDALGVLMDALVAKGVWDNSMVVFTADHGEGFGEHGTYFGHHALLWEETTRVPMTIRMPQGWYESRGENPPARLDPVVSPLDLTPTVMDLLGLAVPDNLDGRSLLPVLRGEAVSDRNILVEFPNVATPENEHPDFYALRGRTQKLIRMLDPTTGEQMVESVSDLVNDPLEIRPAAVDPSNPDHARLVAEMDEMLELVSTYETPYTVTEYLLPEEDRESFITGHRGKREVRHLSPEQEERLRSLGYIQ